MGKQGEDDCLGKQVILTFPTILFCLFISELGIIEMRLNGYKNGRFCQVQT